MKGTRCGLATERSRRRQIRSVSLTLRCPRASRPWNSLGSPIAPDGERNDGVSRLPSLATPKYLETVVLGRVQITFDCAEPEVLARFWAAVLGYPPPDVEGTLAVLSALGQPEDELGNWYRIEDPAGVGPRLAFQRVLEPKVVKNRVHLDVTPLENVPQAVEDELNRVLALGASQIRRVTDEAGTFVVLADPEGNEFCIG